MALCTKKKGCVLCVLLAIYLIINHVAYLQMKDRMEYPVEPLYDGPPVAREECVSFHIISVDESAKEMAPNLFCDHKSLKSDVICRWHLFQQTTALTSLVKGRPSDDICFLPDDTFTGRGEEKVVVPKFVYYVLYGVKELTYLGYMSFLSVQKFVRPRAIYVLSNVKPSGEWWTKVEEDIGIRFIHREKPKWVGDKTVKFNSHAKNMIALQLLMANGGIYIDVDMLILRSLHPLLKYNVTLGLLSDAEGMGSDILMAKKNSLFMRAWHARYAGQAYNDSDPYTIIRKRPYQMWTKTGKRIHVESTRFYNPGIDKQDLLFNSNKVDWSENYAMKIWRNPNFRYPQTLSDAKHMDNTLGQVIRHINRQ